MSGHDLDLFEPSISEEKDSDKNTSSFKRMQLSSFLRLLRIWGRRILGALHVAAYFDA